MGLVSIGFVFVFEFVFGRGVVVEMVGVRRMRDQGIECVGSGKICICIWDNVELG